MNLISTPAVRIYTCKKCNKVFMVSEVDEHIHLLQKTMRCPNAERCAGKIRVYAQTNIKVSSAQKIDAIQLYQASMGAGLPSEKRCGPKDLRKLMIGVNIIEVELEASPDPKRSFIKSLTLGSGKVVHFSVSTKGVTIFKVTDS